MLKSLLIVTDNKLELIKLSAHLASLIDRPLAIQSLDNLITPADNIKGPLSDCFEFIKKGEYK